tara:strand:- start:50 stop:724 length:675 start_codon:yes stop_codon:yes gene_type:complete
MPNITNIKSKFVQTLTAANATVSNSAICNAQTTAGAGDLVIDGYNAATGVATISGTNMGRNITIFGSASDNSGVEFTVVGTSPSGISVNTTMLGPVGSGTSTLTGLDFNTITSLSVNAAITGDITIGYTLDSVSNAVIFTGRTRVRGLNGISAAAAGNITYYDADISTATEQISNATPNLIFGTEAATDQLAPYIPDNGVLFKRGCFISFVPTVANNVTTFYDG